MENDPHTFQSLETKHLPSELIAIFSEQYGDALLPLQREAIHDCDILNRPENTLIVAPTSSGKTFIGELLSVSLSLRQCRSIILVPYRAISEELFSRFVRAYNTFGLAIAISSRDHNEHDDDIKTGNYDIAIIVYEKLMGLLSGAPHLLSHCSLIITDEIQMIMDRDRGPNIELLITKLIATRDSPRIVGLSAVLDELNSFDEWLQARVIVNRIRPVELREGILSPNGEFWYQEYNSRVKGVEKFSSWDSLETGLITLCQRIVDSDEQALIFCNARGRTEDMATLLKNNLTNMPRSQATLRSMTDVMDSSTKDSLEELLAHGIAFHNSDLSLDERLLIEKGVRDGDVKLLCCTSTLAMGINVPVKNVIIYDADKYTGASREPLSVAEYKNMAGRAGRYGLTRDYGRSFLIAESQAKFHAYQRSYIYGRLEGFQSQLGDQNIDLQVLDIVASGVASQDCEIENIIFSTYNGTYRWTHEIAKTNVRELIKTGINDCINTQVLERSKEGTLKATYLGAICARGGYSINDIRNAIQYFKSNNEDRIPSLLFYIAFTDLQSPNRAYQIPRLRRGQRESGKYQNAVRELASHEAVGSLLETIIDQAMSVDYDTCVAIRRSLACYAWIGDGPVRHIERNFDSIRIGSIRNAAEVYAWYCDMYKDVCLYLTKDEARVAELAMLSKRLRHGSTEEALALCDIRNAGLSRDERLVLVSKGISCVDDILEINPKEIPLSVRKRSRLLASCEKHIRDGLERTKRYHLRRLSDVHASTENITQLYKEEGLDLERSIESVLSHLMPSHQIERITRQNEGEPDIIIRSDDTTIVVQITARQNKNVSLTKATSIIGQSAKYRPTGYIVIGRPDFDQLAIKDAEDQVRNNCHYQIITIAALAEMYVLYQEKKLGEGDIEDIIIGRVGYLTCKDVSRIATTKDEDPEM